ncbi:MAG: FG-GAP repeat domain-containing protein, partial [Planctomycetota bacterium]
MATIAVSASGITRASADGPFLFGPPQVVSMPTPHSPTMVAIGDLDEDGDPDLVIAGRNSEGFAYLVPNEDGVLG